MAFYRFVIFVVVSVFFFIVNVIETPILNRLTRAWASWFGKKFKHRKLISVIF